MNAEVALISKVIHTGDFVIVNDKQINGRFFSGRNRKAFKHIQKHMMQYGKVPSAKVFKKKFPDYKLVDEDDLEESLTFYCDEVRMKKKHNTMVDALDDVGELIGELETDEAYNLLQKLVTKIENEVILTDRIVLNQNTKDRLQDYLERAKVQGMTGIPSGLAHVDHVLKGYNGGELIALLGYTGTGKTWMEIINAVYQSKMGYKVLLITTEMSTKMMIRRVDAMWCKLSYSRFRNGNLTDEELDRYKKYLNMIEGDTDANLIVEQSTGGVAQVAAKIDQYKPDVVYVDGAYLLSDDDSEEDDWKALVRVFRALHKLALAKNVPIVASTQSKEKVVTLQTISFAKALSNDCDVVMAIEQDEEMKEEKEMKVKFLKIREGEIPGNIVMNWDFHKMNYETIYIEDFNGNRKDIDGMETPDEEEEVPEGVQALA